MRSLKTELWGLEALVLFDLKTSIEVNDENCHICISLYSLRYYGNFLLDWVISSNICAGAAIAQDCLLFWKAIGIHWKTADKRRHVQCVCICHSGLLKSWVLWASSSLPLDCKWHKPQDYFFFNEVGKKGRNTENNPPPLFLSLVADFWKGPKRWFSTRYILEGIWRFALWEWKKLCQVLTLSELCGYEKNINHSLCPLGVSIPCYYRITQC